MTAERREGSEYAVNKSRVKVDRVQNLRGRIEIDPPVRRTGLLGSERLEFLFCDVFDVIRYLSKVALCFLVAVNNRSAVLRQLFQGRFHVLEVNGVWQESRERKPR